MSVFNSTHNIALSVIENWNESKQAELIDRQRGNYNIIDTREVIKVTQ